MNCPVASYKDELYNLPFQHEHLLEDVGIKTPAEAKEIIERQKQEAAEQIGEGEPSNLEEQALSLIGRMYSRADQGLPKSSGARAAPAARFHHLSACPFAHL